jgi:hypothetical protein
MTSLDHWSYAGNGAMTPLRGIIRITPTRKFIEKRFPSLGFTVDAAGHAFFEVLLATDRALFDAANASRRTPASFYASREHSGLIRAGDEPAVYLVPTAVVQRFAGAREIFYTAACYASAQGQDPAYAMSPAQLAHEAPSVGVASDFNGRALAAAFALPADVLRRVRDDEVPSSAAFEAGGELSQAHGDEELDAEGDREGGEDGYGMTAAIDYDDNEGQVSASLHEDGESGDEAEYAPATEPEAPAGPAHDGGASLDYYDGYDEPITSPERSTAAAYGDDAEEDYPAATAHQSTYAAGSRAPAMLEDEDERGREPDPDAAAYGDEADEGAPLPPAVESLATVPLTQREQRRIMDTVNAVGWPCHNYAAVIPDSDGTTTPPAGVSVGIAPFTQWSGALGHLLKAMEQRDASAFHRIFGSKWMELRNTATAADAADRMKAVDGKELWREPWLTRFKQAGEHKPFQSAQNETAAALFLQPIVPYAHGLGLNSDRGLVMLATIVRRLSFNVKFAVGAALDAAVTAVTPLKTDAQRQQALSALGTSFQQAHKIDSSSATWSNVQHFAVLAELRKGGRSPVPLPSRPEMLDLLVKHARDQAAPWAVEVAHLRTVGCLQDVEYAP